MLYKFEPDGNLVVFSGFSHKCIMFWGKFTPPPIPVSKTVKFDTKFSPRTQTFLHRVLSCQGPINDPQHTKTVPVEMRLVVYVVFAKTRLV